MSKFIDDIAQHNPPCPHCGEALPREEKTCPNCGVDLLLLTLLTERAYLDGVPGSAPISSTPEALIPRIGDYLLDHALVKEDELNMALARQKELAEKNDHRLLGQTLIEMGYIDHETFDLAINLQIIELHSALREANRNLEQRVEQRTGELNNALERLGETNQIKANLISNVSHELRTPLAHIKGYVELLREGDLGELTLEQEEALEVMARSSARLERLIEDLIEFSTAAREGISLNQQPFSLADLAEEVRKRTSKNAEKSGVEFKLEIEDNLPILEADAERLEWVLYQLVDNGIKFTGDGGEVTLGANKDGNIVNVYVRDTGVGIPADRIEEVFLPFHQLDGSPTRKYGGTGLGLALVKLILNSHGSEIRIESTVNEGSLISFSLPIPSESA